MAIYLIIIPRLLSLLIIGKENWGFFLPQLQDIRKNQKRNVVSMAEKEEHLTSLARDHTGFFQKQNGNKNKLFSLALSPEKRQELGRLTGYRQISISSVLSPDSDDTGAIIIGLW